MIVLYNEIETVSNMTFKNQQYFERCSIKHFPKIDDETYFAMWFDHSLCLPIDY